MAAQAAARWQRPMVDCLVTLELSLREEIGTEVDAGSFFVAVSPGTAVVLNQGDYL